MNIDVKKHYDELLADVYSWMSGDFDERVNQTKDFFIRNDIKPSSTYSAIDLGSGDGIQSAALNEIGYNVTAVDFSKKLLEELKQNTGNKVKTMYADFEEFDYTGEIKPELIICMGDTLTHLSSIKGINILISKAAENLELKGKFILSFRDYTNEIKDTSRFIPVKSDKERILTCFIENFQDHVIVNDILYERNDNYWKMKVSSYSKLKISKHTIENILIKNGLSVINTIFINGMLYVISQKTNEFQKNKIEFQ